MVVATGGCYGPKIGNHPRMHKVAPHNKELSSLNVSSAKVEKPLLISRMVFAVKDGVKCQSGRGTS